MILKITLPTEGEFGIGSRDFAMECKIILLGKIHYNTYNEIYMLSNKELSISTVEASKDNPKKTTVVSFTTADLSFSAFANFCAWLEELNDNDNIQKCFLCLYKQ